MNRKTVLLLTSLLALGSWSAAAQEKKPPRKFALIAESPKFWELFDHGAQLETVASEFGFTEGPVWDPAGFLYVSDEEKNILFKVKLKDGSKEEFIAMGDPDGNTYDRERRLLTTASYLRAIVRFDGPGNKYKVLTDHFAGKKYNSPNDVVIGPDGAIYFTDPALDVPPGEKQEMDYQGVYRLAGDGTVTLLTKELTQPNGLAFSPDGKKFYVDDSAQRNIRVYDFVSGTLQNGRIFGEEPGGKGDGVPDGMRVDLQGNIFVTGPKGIWVWTADGQHLGTIAMPEQPANLAWGDTGYGTLYITATHGVYRLATKTKGFVPWEK
ncbi:MAG TPA: SMP-30/gluconolactonase/LRE family protein [Candidatus Saccharimonadales bacterium]|jgi:gluconolactonase|nr:SMP-30/gluconolactonase/LRE family protein [Candidatus Saccharimonadales bacterium]